MTSASVLSTLGQTGYAPPGVYIEETPSTLVGSTGLPPTLVALVGPAIGFQRASEQVTLSDDGGLLAVKGIDLDTVVVTRADTGAQLVGADYDLVQSSTTSGQDYLVTISRHSGASVPADTLVFVTYQYTTPDYLVPRRLDDFEDVKSYYGEPLNLTAPTLGQADYQSVLSPISLAAKIAFENGAGELVLAPTAPLPGSATTAAQKSTAYRSALSDAYQRIETNHDVSVVVPLTDGIITADASGAGGELAAHVDGVAADGYYRIAVLGFDPGMTTAPDVLLSGGGFRTKRLVLAYACSAGMAYYNGAVSRTIPLGHQYLAAAYAGKLASLPVQYGLTRQILRSFSGLAGTSPTNSTKDQLAAAGVAVTETDRLGQLVVRHGLTTDVTNLTTREVSVVRARDALVTLLQIGVDGSGLIGQPTTPDTLLGVKSVVAGLLEHAVITGTVVAYSDLKVRQRSVDPSVIEVKFGYSPAYPINYIVLSFSINVATGVLADDSGDTTTGT
jgi:hypothetical protein